jgi:hypothetical protein
VAFFAPGNLPPLAFRATQAVLNRWRQGPGPESQ